MKHLSTFFSQKSGEKIVINHMAHNESICMYVCVFVFNTYPSMHSDKLATWDVMFLCVYACCRRWTGWLV